MERSEFEPWPGTLCCVLGQEALLSQCLPPPRSINGYRQIVGVNLTNYWKVTCEGLASRLGGVEILLAASCYGNRDKVRLDEPVGSKGFTIYYTRRYQNHNLNTKRYDEHPVLFRWNPRGEKVDVNFLPYFFQNPQATTGLTASVGTPCACATQKLFSVLKGPSSTLL